MLRAREPKHTVTVDLFEDKPMQFSSLSKKEEETIGAKERSKEEISDIDVLTEYLNLQRARIRKLAGLPPMENLTKEDEKAQAQKREQEENARQEEIKRIARKMQELSGRKMMAHKRQEKLEEAVNQNLKNSKNRKKTLKNLSKKDDKKPLSREDINMYIKRRKLQAVK